MTPMLDNDRSEMIRALATVGDINFDAARSFAEDAGFSLLADAAQLQAWCIQQATGGNAQAQYVLSAFTLIGLFGEQRKSSSFEWCSLSAQQHYPPAICMLAGFFADGLDGVEIDQQRALSLLHEAGELGYAPAYRSLAVKYLTGSGVGVDSKLGFCYFEMASKLGDPYSQYMLGTMMLEMGEMSQVSRGVEWIQEAASRDFSSALRKLATFYFDGNYGFIADARIANQYLDRADAIDADKLL